MSQLRGFLKSGQVPQKCTFWKKAEKHREPRFKVYTAADWCTELVIEQVGSYFTQDSLHRIVSTIVLVWWHFRLNIIIKYIQICRLSCAIFSSIGGFVRWQCNVLLTLHLGTYFSETIHYRTQRKNHQKIAHEADNIVLDPDNIVLDPDLSTFQDITVQHNIRGRSQTTLTSFGLFWPPLFTVSIFKKLAFLAYLPTSSCKRSLWTTPSVNFENWEIYFDR